MIERRVYQDVDPQISHQREHQLAQVVLIAQQLGVSQIVGRLAEVSISVRARAGTTSPDSRISRSDLYGAFECDRRYASIARSVSNTLPS